MGVNIGVVIFTYSGFQRRAPCQELGIRS
jgi:hypothetical protein